VVAALLVAGCNGYTTEATNVAKQPDGSYSAQLNFVSSCGSGEHCSWYVMYRQIGTSTWTNVPTTPRGPVAGPRSSVALSEKATGLKAGQEYEYQVCENAQPGQQFVCVGPGDNTGTTTKLTTAAWSLRTTPTPSGGNLVAVSCSSATACTAVGSRNGRTLAERWNGSTWAIQTTPTPSGATSSYVSGVSCASATECIAVGSYVNSAGTTVTLAERWDGSTWTIQTTPTPNGGNLVAVSCSSATVCTAVGSRNGQTLAERWNGSTWTIQATPNPSGALSSLSAVSCTSSTACTAVGNYFVLQYGAPMLLSEFWDGSTWKIQNPVSSSDGPFGPGGSLSAVSCTSATACTAVGWQSLCTFGCGCCGRALAERWNGTSWTIQTLEVPSTDPELVYSSLSGVSCTSAAACTAVGDAPPNASGTLTEFWDGSTWTIQSSPSQSVEYANLTGVSCISATACEAVGGALAERYSG
jgi:hypothetical protein